MTDYHTTTLNDYFEKGRSELEQLLKDENFKTMVYSIKVGDKIKILEELSWLKLNVGHIGTVTSVTFLNENNPIRNHGSIEVDFAIGEGKEERWCHYNWWKYLEIVTD